MGDGRIYRSYSMNQLAQLFCLYFFFWYVLMTKYDNTRKLRNESVFGIATDVDYPDHP